MLRNIERFQIRVKSSENTLRNELLVKLQAVNLELFRKINSIKSILNYFACHLRTLTDAKEKSNNFKMQFIRRCSLYI